MFRQQPSTQVKSRTQLPMATRRFTQHSKPKLFLEKLVKSNVYFYKITFELKKRLGSLFHEEDLVGIDKIDIPKDAVCIDIGANVGQSIEFFKKRFKTIHSFEPNPDLAEYLEKRYSKQGIEIHPYAIGEQTAQATLYIPKYRGIVLHHTASFIKEECLDTLNEFLNIPKERITFIERKVNIRRLDSFDIPNIGFIKIDAEGYESEVVKGLGDVLHQDIVLLIEKSDRSYPFLVDYLGGFGFHPSAFQNNAFTQVDDSTLNVYWTKNALIR